MTDLPQTMCLHRFHQAGEHILPIPRRLLQLVGWVLRTQQLQVITNRWVNNPPYDQCPPSNDFNSLTN